MSAAASAPVDPDHGTDPITPPPPAADVEAQVRAQAERCREAAWTLALATRADKDAALLAAADALEQSSGAVLEANAEDLARAERAHEPASVLDRLRVDAHVLDQMARGLRDVAALPDPVGEVVRGSTLANGLEVRQLRVPLGVVGMVYEGRPNVTVDAAGLCLKSGNAVLLRGSSSAAASNAALVDVLREGVVAAGLPAETVSLVHAATRDSVSALMRARGLVDVLIPRGGAGLIRSVVEGSTVPVIETGVGNCHVYVDAAADLDRALAVVLNAKTQRTSVCNAAESLLVHADVAAVFVPRVVAALQEAGVRVHGDAAVVDHAGTTAEPVVAATEDDFAREYLSWDIAVAVVADVEAAVAHVRRFSSGHTEAVLTEDQRVARHFVAAVDAAAVMVNASTRFTDGAELGFGAEIGISTQKLHARGPMGLRELTSTKFVVTGDGHVR